MIKIELIQENETYKGVPFEACEYEEIRQILLELNTKISNAFYNILQTFKQSFDPLIQFVEVYNQINREDG